MPKQSDTPVASDSPVSQFPSTHWSVVLRAGDEANRLSDDALSRLCEAYRPPVLAYVRRLGAGHADAEDFTQGFFAHFLRRGLAGRVEPRAGVKFRSFLLRCLKNFLADERDRANALKRGAGLAPDSLNEPAVPGSVDWEPADDTHAALLYEREWATALLNQVFDRLEGEYLARGRRKVFETLQPLLLDRKGDRPYADLGAALGISDDAVKQEVSRMRARYRELFREEVAHTVTSPIEVDEEIQHMFAVLSR
jgi:RNA polymerase sigma-70 factor (ECF subfamily)